jgi:hypothetical protein
MSAPESVPHTQAEDTFSADFMAAMERIALMHDKTFGAADLGPDPAVSLCEVARGKRGEEIGVSYHAWCERDEENGAAALNRTYWLTEHTSWGITPQEVVERYVGNIARRTAYGRKQRLAFKAADVFTRTVTRLFYMSDANPTCMMEHYVSVEDENGFSYSRADLTTPIPDVPRPDACELAAEEGEAFDSLMYYHTVDRINGLLVVLGLPKVEFRDL